jgi:DNA-binding SARP family transcriptional activator
VEIDARPTLLAFGGVAAVGPDGPVDLGGPKQRAVLGLLLLDPGATVSLDRIVDRIWGDDPPARAGASVRAYVSHLRKALAGTGLELSTVIDHRDRGYVLLVPAEDIDLHQFDAMVDRAVERRAVGDLEGARFLLDRALELHAGPALGSTADALDLLEVVARYEARRGDAVELMADVRLALGEHAQLPAALASEIAREPYRERLRAQLALALYRAGRAVESLRAIDDARRRLLEDVGVDLGPELRELEAAILAHDPSALAWVPPSSHASAERDGVNEELPAPDLSDEPRFGRDAEEAAVGELVARLPHRGGVLVVSGESGIGKTAVLRALRIEGSARGFVVGWDRCPESVVGRPYRSWRAASAVLMPDGMSQSDRPAPGQEPVATTATAHEHELQRLRTRREPAVVVIDDLQWADHATLRFLSSLAPELERLRILLAVGVRRSPVDDLDASVRDCLAELARTAAPVLLDLRGLSRSDLARWVATLTGADPTPELIDHLVATTRGNPFYVRELLRLLTSEGRLEGPFAPAADVPPAVQDVVRRRVSRLPPETQVLLTAAAVIGHRFDIDVLAGVLDSPMPAVTAHLEPALHDGLIGPDDAAVGRFTFSHAIVSNALLAELNVARRSIHHARITEVIEELRSSDLEPWFEELSYHASQGVIAGTAAKALTYSLRAADAADAVHAHADVAIQIERALAAATVLGGVPLEQRCRLHVRLGIAQREMGDPAGRSNLVEAARLAEVQGDVHAVAEILSDLDRESLWAGYDWSLSDPEVVALVERTLASPGLDLHDQTLLTSALAGELTYIDNERSRVLFADASAMCEPLDDPSLTAHILLQWFWSVSGPSGHAVRAHIGDRLIELAEGGGLARRLVPLAHLSRVSSALEAGDGQLARACVATARATAHPTRTPTAWAHLQFAEAGLALAESDLERARAHADALRTALVRVRRFTADSSPASILAVASSEAGDTVAALEQLAPLRESPYAAPIGWLEAWILAQGGRLEEVPAALARFDGPLPDDWLAPALTAAGIHAAAAIGDTRFIRRNLGAIEPIADRFAFVGEGGPCLGPIGLAVAAAHLALGDHAGAGAHAENAVEICQRIGAPVWLARSRSLLDTAATSA